MCLLLAISARAQTAIHEPAAILVLGVSRTWNLTEGGTSFGPTAGGEFRLPRDLRIEAAVNRYFAPHRTEWETELTLRKAWEVSSRLEFLLGAGPVWVHARDPDQTSNSLSIVASPGLEYWPSAQRKYGFYLEPEYEYGLARGHERAWALCSGMLIAFR